MLVPQSGQFGPPPAAEQTPCTPQQTRLRAPSLPHSASRGQVTQPGHLSVAATGAVQATGAAAAHTPTRRASSTVPEPGLGQGQRSLGAPSSSNSSATPASAASDHTWGTHTPDSECPGSARHLSNAMRGLQLAPTPEAAEAHAHAAGACAASRHADMAHHRGAHASLGAELAAATPFRAAPATAAPRQSLQAGTSAGQQSAALASLAPATATPSATLGSSMHASAGSITPATSTTPVACDGVANPFSQHTTAGLGGTLGDAMSGWDLARMGGMAGAPSLLQHAADLAAAPQLLAAPQLQRQGAAPDVQALVAQLLGQLQQPAGIQPQQPQPHLAAGGLPPAVASLLASLTQQQQGPDVDQQLRLQLLMAAATRLLSAQQQQAAQLQPPQPTSQPLSSLGQASGLDVSAHCCLCGNVVGTAVLLCLHHCLPCHCMVFVIWDDSFCSCATPAPPFFAWRTNPIRNSCTCTSCVPPHVPADQRAQCQCCPNGRPFAARSPAAAGRTEPSTRTQQLPCSCLPVDDGTHHPAQPHAITAAQPPAAPRQDRQGGPAGARHAGPRQQPCGTCHGRHACERVKHVFQATQISSLRAQLLHTSQCLQGWRLVWLRSPEDGVHFDTCAALLECCSPCCQLLVCLVNVQLWYW